MTLLTEHMDQCKEGLMLALAYLEIVDRPQDLLAKHGYKSIVELIRI